MLLLKIQNQQKLNNMTEHLMPINGYLYYLDVESMSDYIKISPEEEAEIKREEEVISTC